METNCVIYWIVIYPADCVIHLLSNSALERWEQRSLMSGNPCDNYGETFYSLNGTGTLYGILGDPGAVSRAGKKDATKVFKHRRKSPWVPTLKGPFPNRQVNAGSWLGTTNALYYCAQSGNSISWVLFASSYTTAFDSITPCLAHAPNRCTQSGNFQFDINILFQNTGCLYTRLLSKT